EPVLIAQLASGEPPDLSFSGATRAAQEWLDVLRQSGREAFAFLLQMEWDDAVARLTVRPQAQGNLFRLMQELGLYPLYEHQHALATFPVVQNFNEHTLSSRRDGALTRSWGLTGL